MKSATTAKITPSAVIRAYPTWTESQQKAFDGRFLTMKEKTISSKKVARGTAKKKSANYGKGAKVIKAGKAVKH